MEPKSLTIVKAHLNSLTINSEKLHPRIICHNVENDHFLECKKLRYLTKLFVKCIYNIKVLDLIASIVDEIHTSQQSDGFCACIQFRTSKILSW
jgi:hypothetical protein